MCISPVNNIVIMKTKRCNFSFSPETDALIRRLAKETDLKMCAVIKKAVEMFAKKHDQEKE